ncbi:MAG TPA: DUF4031 domain-containing protein [Kineosporiaceae bacterium]
MAILIDPPLWPAHGRFWSHLVSDVSFEELHRFARAAGIPARGFEGDHYDVPEERYVGLVAAGARPVSGRELLDRLRRAGLRRPKRRGELVVASHVDGGEARIDVLISTLPPTRPVVALWALVTGPDDVLAVPHGPGWAPPRADLTRRPAARQTLWTEVAAALTAPLTAARDAPAHRAGRARLGTWQQVGYLRRQPLPTSGAAGPEVELVLRAVVGPVGGFLPRPPARWVTAAEVSRAAPALVALLGSLPPAGDPATHAGGVAEQR